MEKLRASGTALRSYIRTEPLSGIKTGFNEAFIVDMATKERLEAVDASSAPLFKPCLRGQDVVRWGAEWDGVWLIAIKSSGNHTWPWTGAADPEAVFRQTHAALFAHFGRYRQKLIPRGDQGVHWWELRACAYWQAFDKPKIVYKDLTWSQEFCLDTTGCAANNTVYYLPCDDLWVMAVLNSPVAWWFAWRTAQHSKDETLRFYTEYPNAFPIPKPTDAVRARVEVLVKELIDLTQDELIEEIRKLLPPKEGLSSDQLQRVKQEYATTVVPLQANARRADQLEREVSDLVNEAFGLTPAEVALMWDAAPPRMPFTP